jgi:hypothetical protein
MSKTTSGEHQTFDLRHCPTKGPVRFEPLILVREHARSDLDSRHRKAPDMCFERVDRRGVCPGEVQIDLRRSHEQPLVLPQFRHL